MFGDSMMRNVVGAVFLTSAATSAFCSPYWIAWEGTELPEVQGPWLRGFGYGGAKRTINNGILTYDSLDDINIWDYSYIERLRQIDPDPGELLVIEWRLNVRIVRGMADPEVGLFSDGAWGVGFAYAEQKIFSVFENFAEIPIVPRVFHEYRFLSPDMRSYELYIDGDLARRGAFSQRISRSLVGWGDSVQGAASLHDWDYLRFGVIGIPEPASLALSLCTLGVVACQRGRLFR